MEFFDWLGVPQVVLMYFVSSATDSPQAAAAEMRWAWIICLIAAAGLYLIGHLFGGFGLMTMAKKQGIKYWWIGFLPFGNTYLTGKLAGETTLFGAQVKRLGVYAMLAEIVYVLLNIAFYVVIFFLIRPEFFELREGTSIYVLNEDLVGQLYPDAAWIITLKTVLTVLTDIFWFVMLILFSFLYFTLFRKYYSRSPFLMAFLCAFLPLRGFVLFAVRKNTPFDYNAYLRRQAERIRRQQAGMGYPNENESYGNSNETPFGEFGGSGGGSGNNDDSPFSDF